MTPQNSTDRSRWIALYVLCVGMLMIVLDATVVNVALPSIQKDLGASLSALEWTINAYTLTFAVLLVTGGRLGDIFGRRRGFLFGVVLFALSSATAGFQILGTIAVGRCFRPSSPWNASAGWTATVLIELSCSLSRVAVPTNVPVVPRPATK